MNADSAIPDASDHARTRWVQRVGPGGLGAAGAWLEAEPLEGHGLHGDEARYHRESNTVMVRKNDTLTTVLDGANLKPSAERAVEEARR